MAHNYVVCDFASRNKILVRKISKIKYLGELMLLPNISAIRTMNAMYINARTYEHGLLSNVGAIQVLRRIEVTHSRTDCRKRGQNV